MNLNSFAIFWSRVHIPFFQSLSMLCSLFHCFVYFLWLSCWILKFVFCNDVFKSLTIINIIFGDVHVSKNFLYLYYQFNSTHVGVYNVKKFSCNPFLVQSVYVSIKRCPPFPERACGCFGELPYFWWWSINTVVYVTLQPLFSKLLGIK